MNGAFDSQRQDSLKRRWQERKLSTMDIHRRQTSSSSAGFYSKLVANPNSDLKAFPVLDDDDLVSTLVPPVTVVLEGRSICQRISLHKHGSYHSLAKALRQMFVDVGDHTGVIASVDSDLDLSNAVPGYLVAYEDMEDDLLLAGDLNWKDFVRVAKRIRILRLKPNARKRRGA